MADEPVTMEHPESDAGSATTLDDVIDQVRVRMEHAVRDEDWDQLETLDTQARVLIDAAFEDSSVPMREDGGQALRAALEALSRCYQDLLPALIEHRGEAARQLHELRAGRRGAHAYEKTRLQGLRSSPGTSKD